MHMHMCMHMHMHMCMCMCMCMHMCMWLRLETACEYNTQHKSLIDSLYTFIMIEFSDILILKHAYTN